MEPPLDGELAPPPPPLAPPVAPTPRKKRRWPIVALLVLIVAGGSGAGAYYLTTRPPEPPGAIRDLQAHAETCVPKECDEITTTVTVEWNAPAAGEVTGYKLFRGGVEIEKLGAKQRSYEEHALVLGESYTYQVQALGLEKNGPRSEEVGVKIPVPPLPNARLDGTFDMELVVRNNRNLSTFLGIDEPAVGDKTSAVWRFDPVCSIAEGACDTKWYGENPALKWKGKTYSGSVEGGKGHCYGGGLVPTTDTFSITVTKARVVGNVWQVVAFKGTFSVEFTCDGRVASASAAVAGEA